ncbi:MAG: prepilin-type N-terminal cleavage/methylation domain-containing protein [Rickettsiales bacterium]
MTTRTCRSGFTLVELAIVLVIIGLIIGGVLVGQDLIKAASIRSVITDVEKINAATTTFRSKYSGLPGDLLNTYATQFGLNSTTSDVNRDGSAGKGDGTGIIEACAPIANGFGCETGLFWSDLSRVALIASTYNTYTSTGTVTAGTLSNYSPRTRLRDAAYLSVFNSASRNYLALGSQAVGAALAGAAGTLTIDADTSTSGLTPLDARGIDEKLDDGAPLTGTVVALKTGALVANLDLTVNNGTTGFLNAGNASAAANRCVNGTTLSASYTSTTDPFQTNPACAISIRASF